MSALLAPWLLLAAFTAVGAAQSPTGAPAKSEPIPMDQIGAVAGRQYQGDGLSIATTPDGARLRCVFQKLEGRVTSHGLWLTSTTDALKGERFRVMASAVGRTGQFPTVAAEVTRLTSTTASRSEPPPVGCFGAEPLQHTGMVEVTGQVARFVRPGLTEEYSVSMDGVRQDFVVLERPAGAGQLRVELEVTGAQAESLANGARLVVDSSGRKIAYSRLRATDAQGKELTACIEVASGILPDIKGAHPAARTSAANSATPFSQDAPESAGLEAAALRQARMPAATRLAVIVDDADAVYPVRIDPTFSDGSWISMGGLPGADSSVHAAVVDAAGNLYIGGEFTVVGDVVANYVAKWNGSSWSALGSGMGGVTYPYVRALAVSGSDLYVGGDFTTAGGSAANHVAKWNGSSWSGLGSGLNDWVSALAVSGSDLYVGGWFTTAGDSEANYVAKWDGSSWSALGRGVGGGSFGTYVFALAVSGSDLYAGGKFTWAGEGAASSVAKWNGSSWSALGSGVGSGVGESPYVYALAVSGSNLYVGGDFTTAGGSGANYVAKWDGSSWSALGSGLNGSAMDLAVSGSDLYVGGGFTTAGGSGANYVAKWNGSSWSALGSGMGGNILYSYPGISAVAVSGTNLYAGGVFTTAGGSGANYVAKWNGSSWSALGSGIGGGSYGTTVSALAVSGSDLYAGGNFTWAGGGAANYVAKWNGSSWSALGSGIGGVSAPFVSALAVSGNDLYVGGAFTTAGGSAANYVAKWDGSSWSALGSGLNGPAALAVSGSDLYVGGSFTTAGGSAATNVAKWNGSSWSALGSGLNGGVAALAVSGSDLYVGGSFTTAGGSAANYIAKWNGSSWSALGSGMDGPVYTLAVSGSDLYAGGYFYTAGGGAANGVARWDGSSWSALGSGLNQPVQALAVSGSDLYVGGGFTTAGGSGANYVAKWDGSSWSALGAGMGGNFPYSYPCVFALAVSGTNLYAGGQFTMAGGKVSAYAAMAHISAAGGRFSSVAYSPTTGCRFIFSDATIGQPYRIQSCWSLASSHWVDLIGFNYPGPVMITDYSALGATSKFYRAVWGP